MTKIKGASIIPSVVYKKELGMFQVGFQHHSEYGRIGVYLSKKELEYLSEKVFNALDKYDKDHNSIK